MSDVVWSSTLDDKYQCEVTRTAPYTGELVMKDGDKEILRQKVALSYDAAFGPDLADVNEWEEICVAKLETLNG